ncbi:MAG: RimK family alpha-L-glutamate ligase [Planctomycetes bacterium]|nr:RimK family alpha-L-glutamate ligase [Planctomycetota bacterium]
MRFAVLTSSKGWHVRDLERAARAAGHDIVPISFRLLRAGLGEAAPRTEGGGISLRETGCVLVRTLPPGSLEQIVFRMDFLHRLVGSGVRVINGPRAIEACVDKFLASARLEASGLLVPRTVVCEDSEAALDAFHRLGRDVVVKPLFGSLGKGMVRVNDEELAYRTFTTLERLDAVLYVQEFIHHPGWDLRALVLGGEVIAAMRRRSTGDWRTNVAQGAAAEPVELSAQEARLAVAAARALDAQVAGIDLLYGPDGRGPYVIEANSVPGWQAISAATGVDVAARLLAFAASRP